MDDLPISPSAPIPPEITVTPPSPSTVSIPVVSPPPPPIVAPVAPVSPPVVEPPVPVSVPPPPPPPPPVVASPVHSPNVAPPKNKKLLPFLGLGAVLAVLGVGAYLTAGYFSTPAKVKDKYETLQPVFEDYTKTVKKITEDLKEESNFFDSAAFERALKKSENLVAEAESSGKTLENLLSKSTLAPLKDYQKNILEYVNQSKNIIKFEKDIVNWGFAVSAPFRDYEELLVDVSGLSNYMVSDPDKYLEELKKATEKERQIVEKLNLVKADSEIGEMNTALAQQMQAEVNFFEELSAAVAKRSTKLIAEAQKNFTAESQAAGKDISRISDKLDEKVNKITDELETLKSQVAEAGESLRREYRF